MASRISRPTRAERTAQAYPPAMEHPPAARDTRAIFTPASTTASKGAPEVPRFTISATRVGTNRAPVTSRMSRAMVRAVSFQWGRRKRSMSFMGNGLLSEMG